MHYLLFMKFDSHDFCAENKNSPSYLHIWKYYKLFP